MLPSAEELKERYSSWSNKRLLFVIHYKKQYTSEAVEIARQELGNRNITTDDVDAFLNEQEQKREREKLLSRVPLTFWEKTRCFFLWFVPSRSARKGFLLREQQTHIFSVAGFISFFIDAFIIIHFRLPFTAGLVMLLLLFLISYLYEKQFRHNLTS